MKNILEANLINNIEVLENLDNISEYLSQKSNELKEKSPCTIDLKFKEGLVQTGNCYTFNTPHKEFLLTADFINNKNNNLKHQIISSKKNKRKGKLEKIDPI